MSDDVTDSAHEASSALFNNRYLVPVVDAITVQLIAGSEMTTVRQVAQSAGLADSLVRPVVLRLAACGIMRPLPRGGPRAPLFYAVSNEVAWEALVRLAAALSPERAAERARSTAGQGKASRPGEDLGDDPGRATSRPPT